MDKKTEALKLALEAQVAKLMEQAQVFASAWSLVGGRFDGGNAMGDAEVAKNELRQMLTEALAEQPAQQQEPVKLWLWKNFVNGRLEYWAFDNAFPVNLNNDDPQVIGEPCGYAWLKPSRQGRFDVSDEEVLRAVQNAKESPPASKPWLGLTEKEVYDLADADPHGGALRLYRAIEAKLREKNA